MSRDIIITVPKSIKWSTYEQELMAAERGDILNFKVANLPVHAAVGSRCYVVYDGSIRGYMEICGFTSGAFTCGVTGREWSGNFIQRTGKFVRVEPTPMAGFQGWRYYIESKKG